MLVLAVLLTPEEGENRESRLTTTSASARAARGYAETLGRLGWTVRRRTAAYAGPNAVAPESGVVHAVLAPPIDLRAVEVSALLDAVRRGASLLVVVERGSRLGDSLGVTTSRFGARLVPDPRDTLRCGARRSSLGIGATALGWPDGMVHTLWLTPPRAASDTTRRRTTMDPPLAPAPGAVDFLVARPEDSREARPSAVRLPAARGWPLGRGRVVVVADPDLLRNDVLRVCRWGAGVTAVRMAEWLGATSGGARTIVFDEYHHGEGNGAPPMRVVARTLGTTRGGHVVAQLAIAALVLLGAAGARAIAPLPRPRVARRSPLEHVDALALAYAQVGATRLAARRLAHGLRRRHARGVGRGAHAAGDDGDASFLRAVALRHPAVAADVDRLLRATERAVPADELPSVAASAAAVDRILTPHAPAP